MIVEEENGISDYFCNDDCWILIYVGADLHFFGQHRGQLTSGCGRIEYFMTEKEARDRASELGISLEDPDDLENIPV